MTPTNRLHHLLAPTRAERARRVRGARRTTQDEVDRLLRRRADPNAPLTMTFGGLRNWPAAQYMNKFMFLTGAPGTGKTTLMRMMMQDQAGMFDRDGVRVRWLVVDPTSAFGPLLFQVLPPHVPVWFLNPLDRCGLRWDLATDIGTDETLAEAAVNVVFPDKLNANADPYWVTAARMVALALLQVFMDRGSDWRLADWVRPFVYKKWIRAILKQSPRTAGLVRDDLSGKQGRSILAVASAEMRKLALIAAASEHAAHTFSHSAPDGFLNQNVAAHLAFDPASMASTGLYASLLTEMLCLHAFRRNDEHNHTVLWPDEGRYMSSLPVDSINARGRGSGLSCVLSSVGIPALESKWGKDRVEDLVDGVFTWIAMSCGRKTANGFSELVGDVARYEAGGSVGENETTSWGRSWSTAWMNAPPPTASLSYARSTSTSTTFNLQERPAVLPSELTGLPGNPRDGLLRFFLFNRDVGVYRGSTPYLHVYRGLPPAPPAPVRRPDSQLKLMPFTREDVDRLKLDWSDEVQQALGDQLGGC